MRLLSLLVLLALAGPLSAAEHSLRVMTFNLRYASATPPNDWPARRPVMKELLTQTAPDIFGTQEGLYEQLKDIAKDLPDYQWIGLGRDGGSRGEFMAIYYRASRFEPQEYDHFWLSDTPMVMGSSTWGHSNRRMVTWVRFLDRTSGGQFYVFNTHFDHQIQPAREKSAALLRERIDALKAAWPVILLGDFNATAGRNKAYETLTDGGFLLDTWHTAKTRRGPVVATFHGFNGPVEKEDRIDWILTRGPVETAWIEINTFSRHGQFPSDHFPVVAELTLVR